MANTFSNPKQNAIRADLVEMGFEVQLDEPMTKHTTLRIGGTADVFVCPKTVDELGSVIDYACRNEIARTIIGRGSNLLVRDGGIRGIVICTTAVKGCEVNEDGRVIADCGINLPRLSYMCARRGLAGLEFGLGVPGTVGGAVLMNAGCHGQEMGGVVKEVRTLTSKLDPITVSLDELELGYRTSSLRRSRAVVLTVSLQLDPGHEPAEIEALTRANFQKKRSSQPMSEHSAGSVFLPPKGDYASRLIDAAGLKGTRCGGASVSTKHAGFIVNDGNAIADDVLRLIDLAQDRVFKEFGVVLELELEVIGSC